MENHDRQTFQGSCWEPDARKVRPGYYNLWSGFPVHADVGPSWDLLKTHVYDNLIRPNARDEADAKKKFGWFLVWCADIIQNPGRKLGTCVVVRGREGVGKSLFFRYLRRALGDLAFSTARGDDLVGSFNSQLDGKLFVLSEEATWSGDKKAAGQLKALITEDDISINKKHTAAVQRSNYIRMGIIGNDEWLVPADRSGDARRYFVLEAGNAQAQNVGYFAKIVDEMEHAGGVGAMFEELRTLDPSAYGMAWDDLRRAPETAARQEQAQHSVTGEQAALVMAIEDGVVAGHMASGESFVYVLNEDTYTDIATVHMNQALRAGRHGGNARAPKRTIDMMLGADVYRPTQVDNFRYCTRMSEDERDVVTIRTRVYRIPSLKECRQRLAKWGMSQGIAPLGEPREDLGAGEQSEE
nr:primase-helicase family protein [Rubellimicrobium arenae]